MNGLVSAKDLMVLSNQMIEMNEKIPNSRLEIIPHTGHGSYREKPQQISKIIESFLENSK